MWVRCHLSGLPVLVAAWHPPAFAISDSCRALLAIGLLSLLGCGPRNDRLAISGTVKLNGSPLDGGSIAFTSLGGEKMLASGAVVQNGQYIIPQEKGLRPGTYHVEINAPTTRRRRSWFVPCRVVQAFPWRPIEFRPNTMSTVSKRSKSRRRAIIISSLISCAGPRNRCKAIPFKGGNWVP